MGTLDTGIHYGFDASGGFYAINHGARRAEYAYATSPHAEAAKRKPEEIARKMLETPCVSINADIVERHYVAVCGASVRKGGA